MGVYVALIKWLQQWHCAGTALKLHIIDLGWVGHWGISSLHVLVVPIKKQNDPSPFTVLHIFAFVLKWMTLVRSIHPRRLGLTTSIVTQHQNKKILPSLHSYEYIYNLPLFFRKGSFLNSWKLFFNDILFPLWMFLRCSRNPHETSVLVNDFPVIFRL